VGAWIEAGSRHRPPLFEQHRTNGTILTLGGVARQ
jgi:hypothetical protein